MSTLLARNAAMDEMLEFAGVARCPRIAPVEKYLAALLGRQDIGRLAPGMCADFFGFDRNTVDLDAVIEEHNRFSRQLAGLKPTRSSWA